jgi:hypothetical protein
VDQRAKREDGGERETKESPKEKKYVDRMHGRFSGFRKVTSIARHALILRTVV